MNSTIKLFYVAAAVLYLMVAIVSCKDAGVAQESPPLTGDDVSFSQHIQLIFNNNGCTGCHPGNANMSLTQGESYSNLVNVDAQEGVCATTFNFKRVLPNNATQSVLYIRVSANTPDSQCGTDSRMPKGGGRLPQASIDLIREWINAGAQNN